MAKRKAIKLPFKIEAQSASVRKAYRNFTLEYGSSEGTRIFLAKAEERGVGNTIRQKVISVYSRGSKLS